jgi:very-short-patch-repair endonuclease
MLAVEVDGVHHRERTDLAASRDECLLSLEIITIRIPTEELFEDALPGFAAGIEEITKPCEQRTGRKSFSSEKMPRM